MWNAIRPPAPAALSFFGSLVAKARECSRKTSPGSHIRLFPVIVAMGPAMILPFGVAHGTESPVEPKPVLAVHLDDWMPPPVSDAEALALRILRREGGGSQSAGVLRGEIAGALSAIRGRYPVTANVAAHEVYANRKGVILALDRKMLALLSHVVGSGPGPFTLHTGHAQFDDLNAQVGVRAVGLFPSLNAVVFHFDPTVDLEHVAEKYSALDEVHSVEFDALLFDGPDIEVSRSDGNWYFVFRDAWGDCPSGCINVDLYFFVVQDGNITRIDPASAEDIPEFAEIRENRGWFRRGRARNSK